LNLATACKSPDNTTAFFSRSAIRSAIAQKRSGACGRTDEFDCSQVPRLALGFEKPQWRVAPRHSSAKGHPSETNSGFRLWCRRPTGIGVRPLLLSWQADINGIFEEYLAN
jgi:hypothetical protein